MFFALMPAHLEGDDIRLRTLKISDGPFVAEILHDDDIRKSCGFSSQLSHSWLSVWWWTRKHFTPGYCIQYGTRPIGLIGVSSLTPGISAEIGLVISDKVMRRRGYGTTVVELLLEGMRRHSFAREVFVKVRSDNVAALSFWKKVGFSETENEGSIRKMSRRLPVAIACKRGETEGHL